MYNLSTKKQVQYSLEQLSRSFFDLMRQKKIGQITVTDICKGADITRRTFYRNCQDKNDLILYATDRLVIELLTQVDFRSEDPQSLYLGFFSFWNDHRAFLDILYRNNAFDIFLNEFVIVCNSQMRYPLQEESLTGACNRELMRHYSNAFVVGGLGQMLRLWVSDGFSATPGEIADSIIFLSPVNR